jgi:hypothetical protein
MYEFQVAGGMDGGGGNYPVMVLCRPLFTEELAEARSGPESDPMRHTSYEGAQIPFSDGPI